MSTSKWADLVMAWEASGETAAAFAGAHGVADSSLRWWKTELARRARNEGARRSPGPGRNGGMVRVVQVGRDAESSPPPMMARAATASSASGNAKGGVSVVVGHARIVVEEGFDPRLLRDVVLSLEVPR